MGSMRVLVAVASKHGSTWEIGRAIGDELQAAGHRAIVARIEDVDSLAGYDAAVVGSAVYAGHWLRPAQRFVAMFQERLIKLPLWLFSSGPLGKMVSAPEDKAVSIGKILDQTKPQGHRVFSGKLEAHTLSFAERAITLAVHAPMGDFRDWPAIRAWAKGIAHVLDGWA